MVSKIVTYIEIIKYNTLLNTCRDVGIPVEKKPTITVNRTQIVQLLNKDGELHCQVEAYPPADVTWYKDSTKLKKEEHYRMEAATDENGHTDATLQILTMERGDEGTYICHAQNKHGSINSTIELIGELMNHIK